MKKSIYTYALIKSLYDQGQDYVDSFWPFAVKIFPTDKKPLYLDSIQKNIGDNFSLIIPLHTLRTILNRAKGKGYLIKNIKRKSYKLTEKGVEYKDKFENDIDVNRRINSLFNDIQQYEQLKGVVLNIKEINKQFILFIFKNIGPLIERFDPSSTNNEIENVGLNKFEKNLINYFKIIDNERPEHYKTFQDIVLGAIISTIISSNSDNELIDIKVRKFRKCQVFLDTNFIFSIMDLVTPEFYLPAKELFALLKKFKLDIKVFNFTINETCRVIGGYAKNQYMYPTSMKINTLYSDLKRKGWKRIDAQNFIMNIESNLNDLGIKIQQLDKDIDLKNYIPQSEKFSEYLLRYKPNQSPISRNHDLAAIEAIRNIRKKSVRKIENSIAFFLTSDNKLSRCNFREMGHKENGTVCEVILDKLLTNILWLKNPTKGISLNSIISVHSQELFVKRRVWEKFYKIISELKQEDKVKDEDISMLFYNSYIEEVLVQIDEDNIDSISREFVLESIEAASKLPKEELKRKVKEKEKEFIENLQKIKQETHKKEKILNEKWLLKYQESKESLRKTSKQLTKKIIIFCKIMLAVTLATPIIYFFQSGKWNMLNKIICVSNIIFFLITIVGLGNFNKIWKNFENIISNKILNKKLKEAKLDKIDNNDFKVQN